MTTLEQSYSILGLTSQASPEEIKQAYRKLAKIWHPDRFNHNSQQMKQAEAKFKEIVSAYEHLKNSSSTDTSVNSSTGIYTYKSDPKTHYQNGVECAEREEYQEAINEFTLAINLDSQFIKAYQYRGFLFSKLGFENRANADLNKAEDLKSVTVTVQPDISYESPSVQSNQLWNLIKTISLGNDDIKGIQFDLERQRVVTSYANGMMKQWDLENNTLSNTLSGHNKAIHCLAFSSDYQFLASGSDDKTIILWNLETQNSKILGDWKDRHTNSVLALAFSPLHNILISGGADKTVKIWHLDYDYEPYTFQGHKGSILAIAIHPNGKSFATGGEENKLRIRNIETGKLIHAIEHPSPISALAFSLDGQFLAAGGKDGTIGLWNTETAELQTILTGHANQISSLCFSHNDQFLISGSWDSTVRVWDINNSQERQIIQDHSTKIIQAVLNAQGNILMTGSTDGSIKVWQLS